MHRRRPRFLSRGSDRLLGTRRYVRQHARRIHLRVDRLPGRFRQSTEGSLGSVDERARRRLHGDEGQSTVKSRIHFTFEECCMSMHAGFVDQLAHCAWHLDVYNYQDFVFAFARAELRILRTNNDAKRLQFFFQLMFVVVSICYASRSESSEREVEINSVNLFRKCHDENKFSNACPSEMCRCLNFYLQMWVSAHPTVDSRFIKN